jgi:hypothetical protein
MAQLVNRKPDLRLGVLAKEPGQLSDLPINAVFQRFRNVDVFTRCDDTHDLPSLLLGFYASHLYFSIPPPQKPSGFSKSSIFQTFFTFCSIKTIVPPAKKRWPQPAERCVFAPLCVFPNRKSPDRPAGLPASIAHGPFCGYMTLY